MLRKPKIKPLSTVCIKQHQTHLNQAPLPIAAYATLSTIPRLLSILKRLTQPKLKSLLLVLAMSLLPLQLITVTYANPITVTALGHNSTAKHDVAAHMPYANPNAPKGGELSLEASDTFNSANPWMTTGVPMRGTNYLYDTLMTGSLDEAFTMYPQLANKVIYDPEDTSWVIYHIHPDAKFWDGTPVTSHDVKATYDALLTKGVMSMRSYLAGLESVEVIDDSQVKFVFKSANNKEILLIVGQFPIFAKSSVDSDFETLSLTPLMGSGPYQLGEVDPGRSVTYVRDPNYWGQNLMVNQGRYNFDRIKYVYYGNPEVAFEGFKVGQYQFRAENKARNWATAYNFQAVQQGLIKLESIQLKNPMPMQGIVMNLRRDKFQDIRVRKALTEALDFEWMNKTLYYNQYERPQSFFHGSELAATGTPSEQEMVVLRPLLPMLEPLQRTAALNEWKLSTTDGNGFNRAGLLRARQLLLDAGYYYDDMQLYQPNGSRATIHILIGNSSMSRALLPYVRNLKRLGFDAHIRQVDAPQYLERVRKFDYDMIIDVFAQSSSPGAEQAYYWGSSAADEQGNRNTAGIKNQAIDSVIDKLIVSNSRDEIILYTKVLDRLLRAGYYLVPMQGSSVSNVAYWDKYRHVDKLPDNAIGIDYWWVDQTAAQKIQQYLN